MADGILPGPGRRAQDSRAPAGGHGLDYGPEANGLMLAQELRGPAGKDPALSRGMRPQSNSIPPGLTWGPVNFFW